MKPYYQKDGITIYHGDCRRVMPLLGKNSIECILTSPPFNVGIDYGANSDDSRNPGHHFALIADVLAFSFTAATESARCYVFGSDRMASSLRYIGETCGWTWVQMYTWCKPNLAGGANKISGDWNMLTEVGQVFRKGKRTPMLRGDVGCLTHNFIVASSPQSQWKKEKKIHPAQWTIELPLRILGRTPANLILDPFMGSGTTLAAAKRLKRQAIGIDIERKNCRLAAERLEAIKA
jgi:DNA modification methylase